MRLSALILKKQSSYNFTLGTYIPLGHTRPAGSDTLCASRRRFDFGEKNSPNLHIYEF